MVCFRWSASGGVQQLSCMGQRGWGLQYALHTAHLTAKLPPAVSLLHHAPASSALPRLGSQLAPEGSPYAAREEDMLYGVPPVPVSQPNSLF